MANDSLKSSNYPYNIDPCLAESFSIGLTVLSAGTLLNCQNLYERHNQSLKFNPNPLESLLNVFQQKYSKLLYDIVVDLSKVNFQCRKSASNVY